MPANGSNRHVSQDRTSRRSSSRGGAATITPPRGLAKPPSIAALPVGGQRAWDSSSLDLELIAAAQQRSGYQPPEYDDVVQSYPAVDDFYDPTPYGQAQEPQYPTQQSYPVQQPRVAARASSWHSEAQWFAAPQLPSAVAGYTMEVDAGFDRERADAVHERWADQGWTESGWVRNDWVREDWNSAASPSRDDASDVTITYAVTPPQGITWTGAPDVPMTRREARARELAGTTALPAARPPANRADRRAADRRIARQGAEERGSRGRRAALAVAVVGLGVALVQDGGSTGPIATTVASDTEASTPAQGATPTVGSTPYRDIFDAYSLRDGIAAPGTIDADGTGTASATAGSSTSVAPSVRASTQAATTTAAATTVAATTAAARAARPKGAGAAVKRMYGVPRSGLPWGSGWWVGGDKTSSSMGEAEQWRGSKMDFATVYNNYSSWDTMADDWSTTVWKGYGGRLAYGLALLPSDRKGQWDDVLSGAHDDVFRTLARNLKANGFGDSVVRVGLEVNGNWFAWGADASSADQFKAAYRRVVGLMRAEAPDLTFWFDTAASAGPLPGTSGRADMLSVLYPGDDVVDGISMDHYDFYSLVAHTDAEFDNAMRPANGTGLQDAVDFARAHGKAFGSWEWGLHAVQGAGDNPFFIKKMFEFFTANKDILVGENYFDEPDAYIANSLKTGQNPQSAAVYRQLWGGQ